MEDPANPSSEESRKARIRAEADALARIREILMDLSNASAVRVLKHASSDYQMTLRSIYAPAATPAQRAMVQQVAGAQRPSGPGRTKNPRNQDPEVQRLQKEIVESNRSLSGVARERQLAVLPADDPLVERHKELLAALHAAKCSFRGSKSHENAEVPSKKEQKQTSGQGDLESEEFVSKRRKGAVPAPSTELLYREPGKG